MFTGLVEGTAVIDSIEDASEGVRISLSSDLFEDAKVGESISVCGACLTVETIEDSEVDFFLAEETLKRTWFSELTEGDTVNLERSLKPSDRMGGHIVQGHVDSVAEVTSIEELGEGWNVRFSVPEGMKNYIVEKGFVAVEGISLTVTDVDENSFGVTIIPETWKVTNLSEKEVGDKVNLEADVTAKYIERIVSQQN